MESVKVLLEAVASVFEAMASTPWTTALSVAVVAVLLALLGEFAE
jgi:cell division protein FtsX